MYLLTYSSRAERHRGTKKSLCCLLVVCTVVGTYILRYSGTYSRQQQRAAVGTSLSYATYATEVEAYLHASLPCSRGAFNPSSPHLYHFFILWRLILISWFKYGKENALDPTSAASVVFMFHHAHELQCGGYKDIRWSEIHSSSLHMPGQAQSS